MTADHDRDRDAGTGRFVTDEYAEQHPDTTVGEDVRLDEQPTHPNAREVNVIAQFNEWLGWEGSWLNDHGHVIVKAAALAEALVLLPSKRHQ